MREIKFYLKFLWDNTIMLSVAFIGAFMMIEGIVIATMFGMVPGEETLSNVIDEKMIIFYVLILGITLSGKCFQIAMGIRAQRKACISALGLFGIGTAVGWAVASYLIIQGYFVIGGNMGFAMDTVGRLDLITFIVLAIMMMMVGIAIGGLYNRMKTWKFITGAISLSVIFISSTVFNAYLIDCGRIQYMLVEAI